jgi:hypothetical protein
MGRIVRGETTAENQNDEKRRKNRKRKRKERRIFAAKNSEKIVFLFVLGTKMHPDAEGFIG